MRPAACVSESEQCTATSWADHSFGAGRQVSAGAGTAAMQPGGARRVALDQGAPLGLCQGHGYPPIGRDYATRPPRGKREPKVS